MVIVSGSPRCSSVRARAKASVSPPAALGVVGPAWQARAGTTASDANVRGLMEPSLHVPAFAGQPDASGHAPYDAGGVRGPGCCTMLGDGTEGWPWPCLTDRAYAAGDPPAGARVL